MAKTEMIVETVGDVPEQMARIVAHALKDRIPGFRGVRIGRVYTIVYQEDQGLRYRTPPEFVAQIEDFKKTGNLQLGEYALLPVKGVD